RAQQFYRNLAAASERLVRLNTAFGATDMAAAVAHSTGLTTLEMLEHLRMAEFAERLGNTETKRAELIAAEALAGPLDLDVDTALYRAYTTASLRALEGDLNGAMSVEQQVLEARNLFLEAPYLVALAELELRSGKPEAAREHAQEAIRRIAVQPREGRRFRS